MSMQRKETVIQFGEGGFLRGFVDYFFQKLKEKELFDGSVVVVQPIEKGMIGELNKQNCEYNLFLRGIDLPQSGRLPAQAGTRPGGAEGAESHGLSHPRCRAERENLSSPRRKTARKHKDVEGGMENGAAGGTERSCLSAVLEIFPAKGPGALRNGGICFEHEQRKADEACRARPKAYRILSMEPGAGCAG